MASKIEYTVIEIATDAQSKLETVRRAIWRAIQTIAKENPAVPSWSYNTIRVESVLACGIFARATSDTRGNITVRFYNSDAKTRMSDVHAMHAIEGYADYVAEQRANHCHICAHPVSTADVPCKDAKDSCSDCFASTCGDHRVYVRNAPVCMVCMAKRSEQKVAFDHSQNMIIANNSGIPYSILHNQENRNGHNLPEIAPALGVDAKGNSLVFTPEQIESDRQKAIAAYPLTLAAKLDRQRDAATSARALLGLTPDDTDCQLDGIVLDWTDATGNVFRFEDCRLYLLGNSARVYVPNKIDGQPLRFRLGAAGTRVTRASAGQ